MDPLVLPTAIAAIVSFLICGIPFGLLIASAMKGVDVRKTGSGNIGTTNAIRKKRMAALYEIDRSLPLRKSHDNPEIQTLYQEFLGEPLSEKAHELLHTTYHKVSKPYEF